MWKGVKSSPVSVPLGRAALWGSWGSLTGGAELAGSGRMETPEVALKQLVWVQGAVWLWQHRAQ